MMLAVNVFAGPPSGVNGLTLKNADRVVVALGEEEDVWGEETAEDGSSLWGDGGDEWKGSENDTAESKGVQFGGEFSLRVAVDTDEDDAFEDDGYAHGQLILKADYTPSDRIQAVVSMAGDYFLYANSSDHDNDASLRFDETYLNFANPGFNIKMG